MRVVFLISIFTAMFNLLKCMVVYDKTLQSALKQITRSVLIRCATYLILYLILYTLLPHVLPVNESDEYVTWVKSNEYIEFIGLCLFAIYGLFHVVESILNSLFYWVAGKLFPNKYKTYYLKQLAPLESGNDKKQKEE